MSQELSISELRLADTVQLFSGAWGTATVTCIKDGIVYMERPYGRTDDFSYTGGVIFCIGTEHVKYPADSKNKVFVWSRKELK